MTAFNSKLKYEKLAVRFIVRVRGHFALLFCRGRLWNVQRFTEHTCRAFDLLIKPFVWWFVPDSVHTTLEEFKNAYKLFLRLGLLSRVIRHENGAFRKRSSNRRNSVKTPVSNFHVNEKHFKTDLFEHDRIRRTTWFRWPGFLQTKIWNDRWLLCF